ncbi:MAG: NusA-like transcription termination signal-binding factor [Thermoplasmata archaeon]|nr:NusA-like transcription termination signal-binding factor [Thermoplasmata archaeon]
MSDIVITGELMQYISIFESATDVPVKDCVEIDEHLIFVVSEGQATKAIGKKGATIDRLRMMLKRKLRVVEFSSDPSVFLMNIFRTFDPIRIDLSVKGSINHATVVVATENKGRAIGKEGRNLRVARALVGRHHDIQSVSVSD